MKTDPTEDRISHYGIIHSIKKHASLEALSWAAERAGQSYGAFIQQLKPGDEPIIQAEYEKVLLQRKADAAKRRKERIKAVDIPNNDPGYILTENDL